jgi:hypothetical protein
MTRAANEAARLFLALDHFGIRPKKPDELRNPEPHQGQDQACLALPSTLRVVQCCVTLISGRIGCSLRTRISAAI